MKQVTQNYKSGKIDLQEVQSPLLKSGGILVRSHYSVISTGTEGMKVREGKMSYLEKARARPDQVKKVMQSVQQQGLLATYQKVSNKLDSWTPLGYAVSGIVESVGDGVDEFAVGDRVACAGVGYANHAELNYVPKNLAVKVAPEVRLEHASFATVGAIAMQGYRQSRSQLGETALVIGLGLLGQLLVQILRAAGMQVVGVDLSEERCRLASELGAAYAAKPDDPSLLASVMHLTRGHGADVIFITAGGSSNGPTELAVSAARDRARVVDIGKTKLDLPWNAYYEKELEVIFSRSYGPGRYDPNYEERGIDYPIGYVRWTEKRNMESFLDLVRTGDLKIDPIISHIKPFLDAEDVYANLAKQAPPLAIVFDYGQNEDQTKDLSSKPVSANTNKNGPAKTTNYSSLDKVHIACIGAGNYANSMLLPHLKRNPDVHLDEVVTTTSLSAANATKKFDFENSSNDLEATLKKDHIDAVVIATRHASHASMTCKALAAGKHVFVEKPLALSYEELDEVRAVHAANPRSRLVVGFNRRYSPIIREIENRLSTRVTPLVLNYRVHAGPMEQSSWYRDRKEGSRFVGEAGHFIDVCSFLTKSKPIHVSATALSPERKNDDDADNVVATITYADGSIATLHYLTQGGQKAPKELLEVFGGGLTFEMNNFSKLTVYEATRKSSKSYSLDKGQKQQIEEFVSALRTGQMTPMTPEEIFDTTLTTLAVAESIREGRPINLS